MKPILVVLAAGMGSRYGGVKQIDSMGPNGETLLDFGTYDAKISGFEKVVFIIRKDIEKDFREKLFDTVAKNFNAEYVFQSPEKIFTKEQLSLQDKNRKKPWGTIHAVLCAQDKIDAPFAVINSDDYYGRKAFEIMANHLSNQNEGSTEHAMIGYVLENTLSKVGTVSRGICITEGDYLTNIEEHKKIGYENEKIVSYMDSKTINLTGKEIVSMNFFGFMPSAFDGFYDYWDLFVRSKNSSLTDEAYLPEAADLIIKSGKGKIKVYSSVEKWFGMTYPEDRVTVKSEIKKKIESGYYPQKLWRNAQ